MKHLVFSSFFLRGFIPTFRGLSRRFLGKIAASPQTPEVIDKREVVGVETLLDIIKMVGANVIHITSASSLTAFARSGDEHKKP